MGNSKSDDETLWELLKELEPPRDADVFSHLPIERQVLLAESRAPQDAADLLEAMPSDDCVDLVQQLAPEAPVLLLGSLAEPALAVCPLNVASRWKNCAKMRTPVLAGRMPLSHSVSRVVCRRIIGVVGHRRSDSSSQARRKGRCAVPAAAPLVVSSRARSSYSPPAPAERSGQSQPWRNRGMHGSV